MSRRVLILDYGWGNMRSLDNAVQAAGAIADASRERSSFRMADALVVPGVGSFSHGMASLEAQELVGHIKEFAETGRPILGICLGMQLLFDKGTEFGETAGLGLIPGVVRRIPVDFSCQKLPHVGWTHVEGSHAADRSMFRGIPPEDRRFYFVHSYSAMDVAGQHIWGTVEYGALELVAAVSRENVWGTQFHPEKSGPAGLRVLKNFIDLC